jgi:GT2 family glycosyltransferase
MRASIVMPVFNHVGMTLQCVEGLLADWPAPAKQLIVVDDGSTDGTGEVLAPMAAHDDRLRVVAHRHNAGFAQSCNTGAAAACTEYVVFLNNDTSPTTGWLDTLVAYADEHRRAAAVGAKLLYPDGTVQHAGVVIGQDRNPHHLYTGFPSDHPAVGVSRAMQVVTGACLLVRSAVFRMLDGFDPAFVNGHEDVDLCLRIGQAGFEVHYCAGSVVVHLESATRLPRSAEAASNGRLYRTRWSDDVVPDDLTRWADDGLLEVSYDEHGSSHLRLDPLLGTAGAGDPSRVDRLVHRRGEQVADLLRVLVRRMVDEATPRPEARRILPSSIEAAADPDADDRVAQALETLDRALACRNGREPTEAFVQFSYRRVVARVRTSIEASTPVGSTVAVVSRGDRDLIDLQSRVGVHFPSGPAGDWLGYHPAGSEEALDHLSTALRAGVTHLVFPSPSIWWLDQYPMLATQLREQHRQVATAGDCIVFALDRRENEVAS